MILIFDIRFDVIGFIVMTVLIPSSDGLETLLLPPEITDTATRAWVASVASEEKSDEDLMRPAAERMAVHFLQEAHSESFPKDAFLFIAGFVNKVSSALLNQLEILTEP